MSIDRQSSSLVAPAASSSRWPMLVIGMLLGIVTMDLVNRRPLMRELAQLRTEMGGMKQELGQLVGVRNQVWETNNLLTGLKTQYRQIEDARLSVMAMQQLNKELVAESEKMPASFASLDQLVSLKAAVVNGGLNADKAKVQADQLVALQDQVVSAGEHAQHANAAINALVRVRDAARVEMVDIEAAFSSVRKLGELKQKAITEADQTDEAREHLSGLVAIKTDLIERGESDQAAGNLQRLIGMQDQLNRQTKEVASAVQNLEVLSDLGEELSAQVDVINSMRKSLMEIVMLESTVNRVSRIIEPLTQLGNLRRLGDEDLRNAARSVMDARSSRIARKPELPTDAPLAAPKVKEKSESSLKIEDIRFFTEEPMDLFVPTPPSEDIDGVLKSLSK